jgi:hypothetical protein
MAEIQKIGRVTFHELTNEEALQKYGSSFVFVGSRPASLEQAAKAKIHLSALPSYPLRSQL